MATSVINYDQPVVNLIAGLDATGHVTHRSYKKKSVTLHHNAGRLSHQGVLNVWKSRPASAHFDVDGRGAVAQYVRVSEYAWATGNTRGNQESISIEMANSSTGGNWPVSPTTWKSAARLAGWLFARVIGERPSEKNFFYHHHWSSTSCAGPYMDSVYSQVLAAAQDSYDKFRNSKPSSGTAPSRPVVTKPLTTIAAEVWAGKWGNGTTRTRKLKAAGYDPKVVQDLVDRGVGKPGSSPAPRVDRKSTVEIAKEVIAGKWGNGDDRRNRLARAGYNATAIQMEVNRQVAPTTRKSIDAVAKEVIAGKWGNGTERVNRLRAAGYSPQQIQAEVNRRV